MAASLGLRLGLSQVTSISTDSEKLQVTLKLMLGGPGWGTDLASVGRPQSQHTQWAASDHPGLQFSLFHRRHTPRLDLASIKASLKRVLLHGVGPCTAAPLMQSKPILAADQPGGHSFPVACQHQSRLNQWVGRKVHLVFSLK